jgi:hypothetical protein
LPPGTPKDLILRRAFVATMRNGEFFAEVKKPRLDVDPVAGEELNRIINEAFKLNPALVGKLKGYFYK